MRKILIYSFILSSFLIILWSCGKLGLKSPSTNEVMDNPLEGLTEGQYKIFNDGAGEFDEVYNSASGLGPIYVATSCGGCHSGDNRGHPFTILTRYGQADTFGNTFLDKGGPQLQNFSLQNYLPELLPAGATHSRFIAPIVSGVGFLELVSDEDILTIANENKNNVDGVRGRPNWIDVPSYVQLHTNAISRNGKHIGRFGRKASTYNLLQQTVTAFNQDMGITSTFIPENPFNYKEFSNPINTNDPEVTDKGINDLVFYLQALQAPQPRNTQDPSVIQGKQTFINIGCESCHKQTLTTSSSLVSPLSEVAFHPYTDLLLHDMGEGLNDNYTEGTALPTEWRTTPLWGLGLATQAQGGLVYLLHDGRAHSIEEAIRLHGGESEKSKIRFQNLSNSEKENLLSFLNSL